MKSELNETRAVRDECEGKLERREKEVQVWKEEVKGRKADVAKLNRRVERFDGSSFMPRNTQPFFVDLMVISLVLPRKPSRLRKSHQMSWKSRMSTASSRTGLGRGWLNS